MVVPTLAAGPAYIECLQSLAGQTLPGVEKIVVDNSGAGRVDRESARGLGAEVIESGSNLGFGGAVNRGFRAARAPYVATLNDDAVAHPDWAGALVEALDADPGLGMCASQVRLQGEAVLDSAGMLISGDGSSKQRGHGGSPARYSEPCEALLPSGSAAAYRKAMLDEIGLFEPRFFLYCEDTDLGLRARWAGWTCRYIPGAVVEHRFSHSAGRASALKAYYVERNRLFLIARNFPAALLLMAPFYSLLRYFWHAVCLFAGRGMAGRYRRDGNSSAGLLWLLLKAHLALAGAIPWLLRERRRIRSSARLSSRQFVKLLRQHWISARQVAAL